MEEALKKLGIGLIGSGFMGRAHALAFRTVGGVFDLAAVPELEMLPVNRVCAADQEFTLVGSVEVR